MVKKAYSNESESESVSEKNCKLNSYINTICKLGFFPHLTINDIKGREKLINKLQNIDFEKVKKHLDNNQGEESSSLSRDLFTMLTQFAQWGMFSNGRYVTSEDTEEKTQITTPRG